MIKTIGIACLAALLVFLAWQFDILLQFERMLDWITGLAAMPRANYP